MGVVVRKLSLWVAVPALLSSLLVGCAGLPREPWRGPAVPDSAWSPRLEDGTRVRVRPLPFGPERAAATLEYLRERSGDPEIASIALVPRMVVVHWTAIPTLEKTWEAFAPELLPADRPEIASAGRVNVSSQFLIDRDGTIYELLPETIVARHTIGLNRVAIGIENVGGPEAPLTDAQLRANAALVMHLAQKYPTIRYLIGHLEYTEWAGSSLWEERDPGYRTEKTDPGVDFLARLRARLAPLGLLAAEPRTDG
ncbi:MAG: N-acetylmuramoyl-L-alanine amidase [Acidobacteria bacterium]|nr:N-acetylmuramoyl-L-alanine amidase [Acidobacteriota bacterium]